jgi:hypothetical protein
LLEILEDRTVPSTLLVTNTLDDGSSGSLRAAVIQADADAAAGTSDTINFDANLAGATIVLTQGQLELSGTSNATITIDATSLTSPVIISGNQASRVFQVDAGTGAIVSGMTIENGSDDPFGFGAGGAIANYGNMGISSCTLTNNTAPFGGAIYNGNFLNIQDCTISNNTARETQIGGGGGIYNDGELLVSDSTFFQNEALDIAVSPRPTAKGGGILNLGIVTVGNSTFSKNGASDFGGAIWDVSGPEVYNSTIYDNFADYGGGIFEQPGQFHTLLTNDTIAGNTASFPEAVWMQMVASAAHLF